MAYEKKEEAFTEIYKSELYKYILNNCKDEIYDILSHPRRQKHYDYFPLHLHFLELQEECPKSCAALLRTPDDVLPLCDKVAECVQDDLYETCDDDNMCKKNIHVRIHSMPTIWDRYKREFPGVSEIGYFITLVGTVVRATGVKLLEFKKNYRCNKCRQTMSFEASAINGHEFPKLLDKCENLCVNAKVEQIEQTGEYIKDYQEIKLQEQIINTNFGVMPQALWVVLEDDLVDSCKPGDDVAITGTLFLRLLKPMRTSISTETVFKANHVQVKNDQRAAVSINNETKKSFEDFWTLHEKNPFVGRNIVLKSFCPQIYGMYLVKLALSVVLAGGVSRESSQVRGESHLLMVGDPGTGKSQLLKYVSKIVPRAVFTNGIGTSSAGLTVSAIKEGAEWTLEAGALVLADSGVCCIDEFSNIKSHDRVSIHEAMEQQSISVAKAGMVCKVNTKCTVVAATNPKFGKYDESQPIEINVGLASPLLSRFDLVLVLKDAQNETWDNFLCDFIVDDTEEFNDSIKKAELAGTIWSVEKLQTYMVLIKSNNPEISSEAQEVLNEYYLQQRRSEMRNEARTTVRLLESLFRLAEGHARLMNRKFVLLHDAITAISLMEASMQSSSLSSAPNTLHIAFPEDPLQEYYNQAKNILTMLGLDNLWRIEKTYLEIMIQSNTRKTSPPSSCKPKILQQPNASRQAKDLNTSSKTLGASRDLCSSKDIFASDSEDSDGEIGENKVKLEIISTSTQKENSSLVDPMVLSASDCLSPIPIEDTCPNRFKDPTQVSPEYYRQVQKRKYEHTSGSPTDRKNQKIPVSKDSTGHPESTLSPKTPLSDFRKMLIRCRREEQEQD